MTENDLAFVEHIRQGATPETYAFCRLTGADADAVPQMSEAEVIKAVMHLGITSLGEQVEEAAWRRAADADAADPDRVAWRDAMHNRHLRPFLGHAGAA